MLSRQRELALRGQPPQLCPEVRIASELPSGRQAGLRQRRRWEHGQLHTMVSYVPRLMAAFLRRPRRALLGLALDLLVPPLALLVMIQCALLVLAAVAVALHLATDGPLPLAAAALACVLAAISLAWMFFGRQTLTLATALRIPFYVVWKASLYATLLVRGKQKVWERTERNPVLSQKSSPRSTPPSDGSG